MPDTLGFRKRIGLVVPSTNTTRQAAGRFDAARRRWRHDGIDCEERQRVVQKQKYDRFETLDTNGSTAADK